MFNHNYNFKQYVFLQSLTDFQEKYIAANCGTG